MVELHGCGCVSGNVFRDAVLFNVGTRTKVGRANEIDNALAPLGRENSEMTALLVQLAAANDAITAALRKF